MAAIADRSKILSVRSFLFGTVWTFCLSSNVLESNSSTYPTYRMSSEIQQNITSSCDNLHSIKFGANLWTWKIAAIHRWWYQTCVDMETKLPFRQKQAAKEEVWLIRCLCLLLILTFQTNEFLPSEMFQLLESHDACSSTFYFSISNFQMYNELMYNELYDIFRRNYFIFRSFLINRRFNYSNERMIT